MSAPQGHAQFLQGRVHGGKRLTRGHTATLGASHSRLPPQRGRSATALPAPGRLGEGTVLSKLPRAKQSESGRKHKCKQRLPLGCGELSSSTAVLWPGAGATLARQPASPRWEPVRCQVAPFPGSPLGVGALQHPRAAHCPCLPLPVLARKTQDRETVGRVYGRTRLWGLPHPWASQGVWGPAGEG